MVDETFEVVDIEMSQEQQNEMILLYIQRLTPASQEHFQVILGQSNNVEHALFHAVFNEVALECIERAIAVEQKKAVPDEPVFPDLVTAE